VLVHSLAITYSQRYITASLASLIGATNPIFTAVFSQTLIGERLTRRKLSGIGLAFVGFLIVLLYGSGRAHFSMDNAIGVAILICSPIGWALYTVLSKPLTGHYEPRIIAGLTTVIGGVLFLPLVAVDPGVFADAARLPALGWLAALTMSVLAIFVGYVVWNRGLRALEATQVAVYMYMTPMFGVLLAWLLLGEHITPWLLLGGATIVAGVVVTNSGRRAALAPQPRSTPVASAVEP
jgi:drug/metabolite transporter (DMT)-like permease